MSDSFTEKLMSVTFTLGTGSFGTSGSNQNTVSNLRMSAAIVKAGGASMGTTQLRVYGMDLSTMNQLSTLGKIPLTLRNNTVAISAGDTEAGLGLVFEGTIADAWVDLQAAPEAKFHVTAMAGLIQAVKSVPPASYQGSADAATVMSSLAAQMGLTFENNGVSVQLLNPYFPGSARDQAMACARAGGFNWIIDNGKLAIWPRNGSRGGAVPLISAATGMIGYPQFTSTGVALKTIYNSSIGYGASIQVQSQIPNANGKWTVYKMAHDLECQMPNGKWETSLEAAPVGYAPVK